MDSVRELNHSHALSSLKVIAVFSSVFLIEIHKALQSSHPLDIFTLFMNIMSGFILELLEIVYYVIGGGSYLHRLKNSVS
jgi:hypothetical protein